MSSKLPSMSANFFVTGTDFNPHDCTPKFRLRPTKVLIKGDVRPGKRPPVPQSAWVISKKWEQHDSWDTAMQALVDKIWPRRRSIRNFVAQKKLKISFTLNIKGGLGERNCLREFSSQTVCRIAFFKAPIYVDEY